LEKVCIIYISIYIYKGFWPGLQKGSLTILILKQDILDCDMDEDNKICLSEKGKERRNDNKQCYHNYWIFLISDMSKK